MKKLFKVVAVAVLSLGFGVAAQAQVKSDVIAVGATVRDQLRVVAEEDLNFGVVMRGFNKMVNAQGGVTSEDGAGVSVNGATPGQFAIYAGVGSSITLRVDAPGELTGPGTAKMPIVFNRNLADDDDEITVGYGIESDDIDASTQLIIGTGKPITFPSTKIGTATATYVWIGGVVKPAADQANGEYSGEIRLTATYN